MRRSQRTAASSAARSDAWRTAGESIRQVLNVEVWNAEVWGNGAVSCDNA